MTNILGTSWCLYTLSSSLQDSVDVTRAPTTLFSAVRVEFFVASSRKSFSSVFWIQPLLKEPVAATIIAHLELLASLASALMKSHSLKVLSTS